MELLIIDGYKATFKLTKGEGEKERKAFQGQPFVKDIDLGDIVLQRAMCVSITTTTTDDAVYADYHFENILFKNKIIK